MTRRPVTALAASLPALPEPQSLVSGLLAVLRPQFAGEVIVPGPADVVLAGQRCAVPGCGRRCQGRGLCGSHYSRWHKSGKPDLTEFTGATGPVVRAWRRLRAAEGYDLCGLPPQLRLERRGPAAARSTWLSCPRQRRSTCSPGPRRAPTPSCT